MSSKKKTPKWIPYATYNFLDSSMEVFTLEDARWCIKEIRCTAINGAWPSTTYYNCKKNIITNNEEEFLNTI
jgi:hypothetical protein